MEALVRAREKHPKAVALFRAVGKAGWVKKFLDFVGSRIFTMPLLVRNARNAH